MNTFPSLKNQFLIAMPALRDPNFFRSVTLICEHNAEGAMGIVINHPLDVSTMELFEHMEIPFSEAITEQPVLAGGPVQTDRGFVIHRPDKLWQSSLRVSDEVAITTSLDIIHSLANNDGPEEAIIALGYAGWGPGQLEEEMLENSWLSVDVKPEILFSTHYTGRWKSAADLLGINIEHLSMQAGHS